jgi:hypothetical protein
MQAIYFVLFINYKYRVTGIRLRIKAKLTKIYAKTFMTVWIGPLDNVDLPIAGSFLRKPDTFEDGRKAVSG